MKYAETIDRYDDQALCHYQTPLSELDMDPRTIVSHGAPKLVRGAFLSVLDARTQFTRDGEDDGMANDLDHAVKFLLGLMRLFPE